MRASISCFILVLIAVSAQAVEAIPGVDSHYGVVKLADGSRLQSIITLPAALSRKMASRGQTAMQGASSQCRQITGRCSPRCSTSWYDEPRRRR